MKTGFVRTPKFGVRKKTDEWKSNSYVKGQLLIYRGPMYVYFAWGLNLSFTFKVMVFTFPYNADSRFWLSIF